MAHIKLDPNNQYHWGEIIEQSAYSIECVAHKSGLSVDDVVMFAFRCVKPVTKEQLGAYKALRTAMFDVSKTRKITPHKSYGYATPEQIKELATLPLGEQRNKLLVRLQQQAIKKGKIC